jgi:hypothetical protein
MRDGGLVEFPGEVVDVEQQGRFGECAVEFVVDALLPAGGQVGGGVQVLPITCIASASPPLVTRLWEGLSIDIRS